MTRPFNFSAGPAAIPAEVLQTAAAEMLDWHGSGMGVMEMSHRGKEFGAILARAESDLRTLLAIPQHFHVLFMQGGGLGENAIVPLNLSRGKTVDFVVTGSWSQKSAREAQRYCTAHVAASNADNGHTQLPDPASWQLSDGASYVHLCSNETIHGVEFQELPDLAALGSTAPLVIDFSSHVASRSVDWRRVGLAFGGAQKNIGPAGLTLVVVRDDLLGHALEICPSAFNYRTVADNQSMFNTPPTWAIYVAGLTFESFGALEQHLAAWMTEADRRVHGTTHEVPLDRFLRDEQAALRALPARPLPRREQRVRRRVAHDAFVDVETVRYSVPYALVREHVDVAVGDDTVRVFHGTTLVATHRRVREPYARVLEPAHVAPEGTAPQGDGRQHEDRRDPEDHDGAFRLLPPAVGVNWSLRFMAQAASVLAGSTGRSSP